MDKLIIDVRINEYTLRDENPNVPYSPEEIANQALECWREGASILHYHARDPKTGAPSADVKLYAEVARLISRVAQMTREMGRQVATPEETRKALGLA